MSIRIAGVALLAGALAAGCADRAEEDETIALAEPSDTASAYWPEQPELTTEEIERGRLDMSWREAAEREIRSDTLTRIPSARSSAAPDSAAIAPVPPADRAALPGPEAPIRVRADTIAFPERYEDLGRDGASGSPADSAGASAGRPTAVRDSIDLPAVNLPLHGDVQGPSVLYVQVLLDRSPFRPGILDGKWGKNTEKAVYWLQHREGMDATGTVDSVTFRRLYALAGRPDRYVRTVTLDEDDVSGPFTTVPGDIYEQAELDCLCYESALEKVSERYHSSPDLLRRLNPDRDLSRLAAGDSLKVPNVVKSPLSAERDVLASATGTARRDATTERGTTARSDTTAGRDTTTQRDTTTARRADVPGRTDTTKARRPAPATADDLGDVAKIVISGEGFYLHLVDSKGRILRHYPTTLGSKYAPSPEGVFSVAAISFAPWFHWKPDLLTGEDPSKPDARLPPGPNSPVGLVWMQLSKDHYGIHGTAAPATIGYVTSHGCIRLTNWDAVELAHRIAPGVPVEFRDVSGRSETMARAPGR